MNILIDALGIIACVFCVWLLWPELVDSWKEVGKAEYRLWCKIKRGSTSTKDREFRRPYGLDDPDLEWDD